MRLVLIIAGLAVVASPQLVAQDQVSAPPPSLEEMLARARTEAAARRSWVAGQVRKLLGRLRRTQIIGGDEADEARQDLIALGTAAVPHLLKEFGKRSDEHSLTEIAFIVGTIMAGRDASEIRTAMLEHVKDELSVRRATALQLLGYVGTPADMPTIFTYAKSADDTVRASALRALSQIDPKGLPATIWRDGLRAASALVRGTAVWALGRRADPEDVDAIVARLEDTDRDVILAAIRALPAFGSARSLKHLHGMLEHSQEPIVRETLDAVATVGTKDLSGRHLKNLLEDESREYALRKKAAKVLFDLGDRTGLRTLAEPLKKQISRNPRRTSLQRELGGLYWEFRDYKNAASTLSKSITSRTDASEARAIHETCARCYARMRNFRKAKDHLEKSGRGETWPELADDEDFAEMAKDRTWGKYFRAE